MLGKILKALAILAALVVGAAGCVVGYCKWNVDARTFAAPFPEIKAATSPEALARGEVIFTSMCGDCHTDRATGRATGRFMDDVPAFLGVFNTANLTHDAQFGIGGRTDGEIARTLRTGIRHDGTLNGVVMPQFTDLADDDIGAVLGYMRSDADPFKADPKHLPRSEPSIFPGLMIQTFVLPPVPDAASRHVVAPEKRVSIEFGRYAANAVYNCWDCHTEGFGAGKLKGADAYGGGFELADGLGRQIFGSNITNSPEGIGGWTWEQFSRAVRDGVRPDGTLVRPPMPRWRAIDDTELQAIYTYLQTVPPSHKKTKEGTAPRVKAPPADTKPDAQFVALGCVTCHAKGAPFHEKLKGCVGKPVDAVAAWIRNPEKTKPNTQMPTFADLLTEDQAKLLAQWVQENPAKE